MKILSLDLELNLNTDEGNTLNSKTTDIIQIGACVLDTDTGNIVDTFNSYINLQSKINGELRLSKYITKLTGITDEMIKTQGKTLLQAYVDLVEFCEKNNWSRIPMTWGTGDIPELKNQLDAEYFYDLPDFNGQPYDPELYEVKHLVSVTGIKSNYVVLSPLKKWWFSKHEYTGFFDVKKLYQTYKIANNKKINGGLRTSVNSLGLKLPPNMSYHDAVADSIMTALIYYKLMNMFKEAK